MKTRVSLKYFACYCRSTFNKKDENKLKDKLRFCCPKTRYIYPNKKCIITAILLADPESLEHQECSPPCK